MAPRRDYSDEYRRRQERAREEGFASDYERRMRQGDPGRDLPRGEEAEYLRGHRGEEYLRGDAQPGDLLVVETGSRDSAGRFTTLMLIPEGPDRPERLISIRGMDSDELADLLDDLIAEGVTIDPDYLEKLT